LSEITGRSHRANQEIHILGFLFPVGVKLKYPTAKMGSGASTKKAIPTLYVYHLSPPCRAVIMTAKLAGIPLDLKVVNLLKEEQKEESYLKINPDHTVPTLVIDGVITLWESRAIMQFLIDYYAPNNTLYPRDPTKRALIDRMLQYDLWAIFDSIRKYVVPQVLEKKDADPEKEKEIIKVFDYLENILQKSTFVAGPNLTIADISIIADLSLLEIIGWDFEKWTKVNLWRSTVRLQVAVYDEINSAVLEFTKKWAEEKK